MKMRELRQKMLMFEKKHLPTLGMDVRPKEFVAATVLVGSILSFNGCAVATAATNTTTKSISLSVTKTVVEVDETTLKKELKSQFMEFLTSEEDTLKVVVDGDPKLAKAKIDKKLVDEAVTSALKSSGYTILGKDLNITNVGKRTIDTRKEIYYFVEKDGNKYKVTVKINEPSKMAPPSSPSTEYDPMDLDPEWVIYEDEMLEYEEKCLSNPDVCLTPLSLEASKKILNSEF